MAGTWADKGAGASAQVVRALARKEGEADDGGLTKQGRQAVGRRVFIIVKVGERPPQG